MNISDLTAKRFFKVMVSGQAYLNLVYLLAAFPLGVFYFVFLVSGLSLGISLTIIWIGIPILLLVGVGWWGLALFERLMAVHILKENLSPMQHVVEESAGLWARFKTYLVNPFTWKSLLFLFVKFPLGLATFVVVVTLVSLTTALLSMPFVYQFAEDFQAGIILGPGMPAWSIDTMPEALLVALMGLLLWPVTLHVLNGLTWIHAKLARIMLTVEPIGKALGSSQV